MTTTHRIAITPRDGLFCKDGRGWHTSASGRGHALDWPWPSTTRGALLTARGRAEEAENGKAKTREEWLNDKAKDVVTLGTTFPLRRLSTDRKWSQAHRVWPTPADALWLQGRDDVVPLDPEPPLLQTAGRDADPAREALWVPRLSDRSKPRKSPNWLSDGEFLDWLCNRSIATRKSDDFLAFKKRIQVHVGINAQTGTADEGILFAHDVVEFLERTEADMFAQWSIAAEADVTDGKLPDFATLGSDGRLAMLDQSLPANIFAPPQPLLKAFEGKPKGLRLVAVTPVRFENGWLPDRFESDGETYRGTLPTEGGDREVILRSAFVGRPIHVSGWDMANGKPKQTDRLVPPGATYFLEPVDQEGFTQEDAASLWLTALGTRNQEGFGRVVPGVWHPQEAEQ